jgi:hypothetical protein
VRRVLSRALRAARAGFMQPWCRLACTHGWRVQLPVAWPATTAAAAAPRHEVLQDAPLIERGRMARGLSSALLLSSSSSSSSSTLLPERRVVGAVCVCAAACGWCVRVHAGVERRACMCACVLVCAM